MPQEILAQISNVIQTTTPFVVAAVGWIVLRIRHEILEKDLARLKEETAFKLEIQRQLNTLTSIDESLKTVRARQHDMASKMTTVELLVKEYQHLDVRVKSIEERMTDKAKRMIAIETRSTDIMNTLHDIAERLTSLERYTRDHKS